MNSTLAKQTSVTHAASTGLSAATLQVFHQRCALPALVVYGARNAAKSMEDNVK